MRSDRELIRLSELPGIRKIEELYWNPSNLEPPMRYDTVQLIDAVSLTLFGITEHDIYREGEEGRPDFDQWELQFEVCYYDFDEAAPVWTALGWDLANDRGEELFCAVHFSRQIVAATRKLMPAAVLRFLGESFAGTEKLSGEENTLNAERWGGALAAEARLLRRSS